MVRVDAAGIGESDRRGQCGSGQRGGEAFQPTPGNRSAAAGAGRRGRSLFVECSKLTPIVVSANDLALDFDPPIMRFAADILQQMGNLGNERPCRLERAEPSFSGGVARKLVGVRCSSIRTVRDTKPGHNEQQSPNMRVCPLKNGALKWFGRLPKWPTGADCKSAGLCLRWFESSTYHHSRMLS